MQSSEGTIANEYATPMIAIAIVLSQTVGLIGRNTAGPNNTKPTNNNNCPTVMIGNTLVLELEIHPTIGGERHNIRGRRNKIKLTPAGVTFRFLKCGSSVGPINETN